MIDTVISDTEDALRAVAKLVDPCRVDKQTKNSIKFGHRVMWVFRDNPSVRDKHQKLQICHQSLTVVFTCLYSKDVVVITPAPERKSEEQPPPYDPQLKELLDWQNRRTGRKRSAERESHTNRNLGVASGTSTETPAAGPSSPCLLAIALEDNGTTPSLSTHFPKESFELPCGDTFEVQPSVPRNNPLSRTATSSELEGLSSYFSSHNSSSNETQIPPSTTHTNGRNKHTNRTQDLPDIKSPSFTTLIASHNFSNDEKDVLQVDRKNPMPVSFSGWNQKPFIPVGTPSRTSYSPTLPSPAVPTPASSTFIAGDDLGFPPLEHSRHNTYTRQTPTDVSSLGQHPLLARINSDNQQRSTSQFDRLDNTSTDENGKTKENRAVTVSVGSGLVKRGGRSWLAYHATRSDTGHEGNWDG